MNEKATILVVEDDALIRKATCKLLESAGHRTLEASNGEEALRLTRSALPDLVLLDVNMPFMDGLTVLKRIKADPNLASVFVVIVSGSRIAAEDRVQGLETGADAYLIRPISNRELLAHIQAMLRIRAAENRLRKHEQQLRHLVISSTDGILVVDEEGKVLFANPAACDLLNRPPESILNQPLGIPLVHKEHADIEMLRSDGQWRTVELRTAEIEWEGKIAKLASLRDITERKRAEEALRQSEERHRLIADMMSDYIYSGIVFPNARAITEWVSGAFERITGYSMEEVNQLPDGFSSLLLPEDLKHVLQQQPRLFENGEASVEYRIRRKDGETRWIRDNMKFVRWDENGAFRVIGAVQDITEQKMAEEKLRQSEEKYRHLYQNAPIGLCRTRIEDGKILESNEQLARMLGYSSREEFIAEYSTAKNYVDPGTREKLLDLLYQHGTVHNYEARLYRKDGSILWARFHDQIYPEQGWIESVVEDITEQKQAEQRLRQSEEKYRLLAETTPDMIILHDIQGKIQYVNHAGLQLFGLTEEEILGQPIANFITGEEEATYQQRIEHILENDGPYIYEAEFVNQSGQRHIMEVCTAPVMSEGEVAQILIVARDITERKRAEEAIQRLNAELEARVEERTRQLKEAQEQLVRQERLAVLGQLAGGVGHELRNPLAVISNAVYFLKLIQPGTDPRMQEYLDIIERETRNAEKIITDLLDFARIKSVERQAISAAELVHRVFERYPPPENIRLVLDLSPDLPPLWVDARQIEQVLGNLVLNAYQAMPSGGKLSIIGQRFFVPDSSPMSDCCLRITVKDTGPGIPPENFSRLFEPLFTTKSHGIGLGLAVSKKLTEANGGRIEVESEPGQGAAFHLILPTAKENLQ